MKSIESVITHGLSVEWERNDKGLEHAYTFRSGNKQFQLSVLTHVGEIYGRLDTIPNAAKQKGSTTAIFNVGRNIMQEEANREARPMLFFFVTETQTLKDWVLTAGQAIFSWDKLSENQGLLQAEKEFVPMKGGE